MGGEIYHLNRDATEQERLAVQHRMLGRAIGFLLHPTVKATLGPHAKIADIATGTGVVLLDLAKELPSTCELDGFDISDRQFPPAEDLPQNVRLRVSDATKPMPPEFHNKYDLVYIRYLNLGVTPDLWEIIAHNIVSILKPGGYIQWLEPDLFQASQWYQQEPGAPSSTIQTSAKILGTVNESWNFPCKHLEGILETVGFQDVLHELTSTDRIAEDRAAWAEHTIGPIEVTFVMAEKRKGDAGLSSRKCAELAEKLLREARSGLVYTRFDLHLFVGRKP